MFLYLLLGFTYSNILTCSYTFKTHIHPYIQIVNIVFTCSGSHCCECAGADGLFELSNLTEKAFQTRVNVALEHVEIPEGRRSIALCFIDIFRASGYNKVSPAASSSLKTRPGLDRVSPEGFSPPYCFQYCCCVSCGWRHPGLQRRSNWAALTEFNKGEGLHRRSRPLPRPVSIRRRGQKRSWGPRWMMIGVAMVCGW